MTGASLLTIAGVLTLGAISPGASFLLVARLAAGRSRAAGFAAALGMGVGCALFALAALLGLQALLAQVPALHRGLSVAGAAYLLWLAWRAWRTPTRPVRGSSAVRRSLGCRHRLAAAAGRALAPLPNVRADVMAGSHAAPGRGAGLCRRYRAARQRRVWRPPSPRARPSCPRRAGRQAGGEAAQAYSKRTQWP
ncbi:LysE family transporter [Xanthomonas sp. NCPPB 1128]|uniref:LysE family translocator n=1 Tax=Xanthomonas sp. NCPPB 1128 TaxID=1775876 RepID=UPI000B23DE15|nr:LysE family transporter [Xanthomonas sp. NCPPB 1128]